MTTGERAALEGFLTTLHPELAIEIGVAQGGSLARLARHSGRVHAFDLDDSQLELEPPPNVTLHIGDNHELLPRVLGEIAGEGRNVDLALIDGDHSTEGVRRDIEDLLGSGALRRSVLLIHDTMNEHVRAGVQSVAYEQYPDVTYVDLDCVPGYLMREGVAPNELWGGLGLILMGHESPHPGGRMREDRYADVHPLLLRRREELVAAEQPADGHPNANRRSPDVARLNQELEDLQRQRDDLELELRRVHHAHGVISGSRSWQLTAPLRAAMRLARALRRTRGGQRS
jgi:hypothetical protein